MFANGNTMMRLDKFLVENNICSRSEAKKMVQKGLVSVNGLVVKSSDVKISEDSDQVMVGQKKITYEKFSYYVMNKPAGYVCSNKEKDGPIVFELMNEEYRKDLFTVGRLDKDTTGLLLITNDGALNHRLLSPKYHVDKTYIVSLDHPMGNAAVEQLEKGLDIGDEEITLPAKTHLSSDGLTLELTIHEGRYHQVKRMVAAVDNEVITLHRKSFGPLELDEDALPLGCVRKLSQQEIKMLIQL